MAIVDTKEICKLFNVKESLWRDNWRLWGVPVIRVGKRLLRYDVDEVADFFRTQSGQSLKTK